LTNKAIYTHLKLTGFAHLRSRLFTIYGMNRHRLVSAACRLIWSWIRVNIITTLWNERPPAGVPVWHIGSQLSSRMATRPYMGTYRLIPALCSI